MARLTVSSWRSPSSGRHLALTCCMLMLTSCGDVSEPEPDPPLATTLTITAPQSEIRIGQRIALAATVLDQFGAVMTQPAIVWSATPSDVAVIDGAGTIEGVGAGESSVTATSGSATRSISMRVSRLPVGEVRVTPSSLSMEEGDTALLSVTVYDSAMAVVTDRNVGWTSNNLAVAAVNSQGLVRALGPGSAVLNATSEGKSGATSVVVTTPPPAITVQLLPSTATTQVGGVVQLVAIVTGTTNTEVRYSSSAPAVASVTGAGEVRGLAPGTATIIAVSAADSSQLDTSAITVIDAPPTNVTISITPTSATISVGATQTFVATVTGTSDTDVTWSSSRPEFATIDENGVARGVATGVTAITARSKADPTRSFSATLTIQ